MEYGKYFKTYDFVFSKAYQYYSAIKKKSQKVSGKVFSTKDFEIKKIGEFTYVKHNLFTDIIVRQAECDGFVLHMDGEYASFFWEGSETLRRTGLFKHFAELEAEFMRTKKDQTNRKTPLYAMPGEKKPLFKCTQVSGPIKERVFTKNGWRTHTKGFEVKGYSLQLLGGNDSVQKLLKADPGFLPALFDKAIKGVSIKVQRIDINCDINLDIIPEILKNAEKSHFNSFGKGLYAVPDAKKKKKKKDDDEDLDIKNESQNLKKAIRITKNTDFDNPKLKEINLFYVGTFKKSAVTITIYNKRSQAAAVKKTLSPLKSRIEPRIYPKNQQQQENSFAEPDDFEIKFFEGDEQEEQKEFDELQGSKKKKQTKNKPFQQIAKSNVSIPLEFYSKIFENYNSEISQGLRNVVFLQTLINGFTLNPNIRDKKELTPWYVDNFITPNLVLVEKTLLENQEFTNRVLKPGYKKEVIINRGEVIPIREPLIVNGEPCLTEEQINYEIHRARAAKESPFRTDITIREPKKVNKRTKSTGIKENILPEKTTISTVLPSILTETQLKALETDLVRYLSSKEIKKNTEKDFLENYLLGNYEEVQPYQPQNARYETWRRGDRAYNLPWIKIKRKVYEENRLGFKRYLPDETKVEKEMKKGK